MTDASTIGRRSKNKGKAYERRIAALLSEFTGKNFRKVPSSGGFNKFGGAVVAEYIFTGDVICDDPNFSFSVEGKNRPNDFSFAQLATVPESAPFTEWWHQTIEDASSVGLLPLLFFKAASSSTKTVGSDFIATTKEGLDKLGYPKLGPIIVFDIYNRDLVFSIRDRKETKIITKFLPNAFIISWRLLVKNIDPLRFFD